MQITVILTKSFWTRHCEPLRALDVFTWQKALDCGLINQTEFHFCLRQTGDNIPTETEFNNIQKKQLMNFRALR